MKNVYTVLLLMAALHVSAQENCDHVLQGRVLDEHDGEPLPYAGIYSLNDTTGTVADGDGHFAFKSLCQGVQILVISHVGCEPDTVLLDIRGDTNVVFLLEHHSALLKMLTVEAVRPHTDIAHRTKLREEEFALNEGKSLAMMIDHLEGVQSMSNGGNISKPMIHGLHSNRLVLIQGKTRIQGQQWGGEHAPEIDPFGVDDIEVVQGAAGLRYGPEAMGGAIIAKRRDITIKRRPNGWLHTAGSGNGRKGVIAASLQGGLGRKLPLYYQIQGSFVNGGDLRAPRYFLDNTGIRELNGSASLLWVKPNYGAEVNYSILNTELGILSYAHIGNLTDLQKVLASGHPDNPDMVFSREMGAPYQHVEHELTEASYWWKPGIKSKFEAVLSRQYNLRAELDKSAFSDETVADLQYEITTHQAEAHFEHRFNEHYKMEWGTAYETQGNTYTGRYFIPNFRNHRVGAFTAHHLYIRNWEFEAGLRYDFRNQQAFMFRSGELYKPKVFHGGFAFNTGANYLGKGIQWLINLGRAWRPPSINELYSAGLHHGAASIEYGDETLREERMNSATLGMQLDTLYLGRIAIKASASVYAYYFEQYIYLVPDDEFELTIRGAFPVFRYRGIDAFFRGADLRTSFILHRKLVFDVSAELVHASDVANGNPLIFIPPLRSDASLRWNVKEGPFALSLDAGADIVGKQSRVPSGLDFASPPPAFVLFNLGIYGTFPWMKGEAAFSLRMDNVLDTAYRNYLNRLRYFADEPGRNVVLTLRLPINF